MNSDTYFNGKIFFLYLTSHFLPSKERKICSLVYYLLYQSWSKTYTDESAIILNMNFYPFMFQFKHLLTGRLSRKEQQPIFRFSETVCNPKLAKNFKSSFFNSQNRKSLWTATMKVTLRWTACLFLHTVSSLWPSSSQLIIKQILKQTETNFAVTFCNASYMLMRTQHSSSGLIHTQNKTPLLDIFNIYLESLIKVIWNFPGPHIHPWLLGAYRLCFQKKNNARKTVSLNKYKHLIFQGH